MSRLLLVLALSIALMTSARAAPSSTNTVRLDAARLAAEMRYFLCSADGEAGDIMLHVLAEATISEQAKTSQPVGCATFEAAKAAVAKTLAARTWVAPHAEEHHTPKAWAGCAKEACVPGQPSPASLQLQVPTYIRLLEFGHEQASSCATGAAKAIDEFVKNLAAGCGSRACGMADYIAARPMDAGCHAI